MLQEFVDGPFSQNNLDAGASMIIPVPGPTGGLIVVGESVIMYVRAKRSAADQAVKSIQVSTSIVKVSPVGETAAAVLTQWLQLLTTDDTTCCNTSLPVVMQKYRSHCQQQLPPQICD